MQQAKKGDTVRVHYTGKLTSGEQFDSSAGLDPLEFEVGAGMMIKGFDDAMVGMTIGDKKTINIPAHEAYGERNEQMVIDFPRSNFPEDMAPEAGMQLMMNKPTKNSTTPKTPKPAAKPAKSTGVVKPTAKPKDVKKKVKTKS